MIESVSWQFYVYCKQTSLKIHSLQIICNVIDLVQLYKVHIFLRLCISFDEIFNCLRYFALHVVQPYVFCFLFFFLQTEMLSLPPDNRIVAKVRDIVIQDGIKSVSEMKMLLETFVRSSIFQDRTLPSASNRQFYPTDKDIHSMIYRYDITFAKYAL